MSLCLITVPSRTVSMFPCLHLHVSMSPFRYSANGNGTNGEWKQRKRKFVFLGRKTISGNRNSCFQQTCPSMGYLKSSPFPCNCPCEFLYEAMNCPTWRFPLSVSKAPTRWRRNLKGLSHKRGWVKSNENLPWTETYQLITFSAKSISVNIPFLSDSLNRNGFYFKVIKLDPALTAGPIMASKLLYFVFPEIFKNLL